ncbi:MAG: ABC transporter permease [Dehalococcoidia bacterium]
MASSQGLAVELPLIKARSSRRTLDFLRRFSRNRGAVGGAVLLLVIIALAILAPMIAPYDPLATDAVPRQAPSRAHLMGTDELGRDELSRVLWGGRISLWIGLVPVAIATVVGTLLGMSAGYFGDLTDTVIMRCIDIMMAFPGILLALAIIAVLGTSLSNLMIAVGISAIPLYTRLMRGSTLSAKHNLYVDAARTIGAGNARIVLRHIFPNVLAPLIVVATLGTATAILVGASLSFLGLGQQPPTPEWGSMLSTARPMLRVAWWTTFFPGLAISLTVLAINMVGDGLREVLDPRLRTL